MNNGSTEVVTNEFTILAAAIVVAYTPISLCLEPVFSDYPALMD
jgi:hypothetical protein